MHNDACEGQCQGKLWWRLAAILMGKSFVVLGNVLFRFCKWFGEFVRQVITLCGPFFGKRVFVCVVFAQE